MLNDGTVADVDLFTFDSGRHGNHDSEILNLALEVIRHGNDGPVIVTDENHLGRAIEEAGIGFGNVETAEGLGRRRDHHGHQGRDQGYQVFHV
jgi:hypothetical protein